MIAQDMCIKIFTGEFIYILEKDLYFLQHRNEEHIDFVKNCMAIKRMQKLSIYWKYRKSSAGLNRQLLTVVTHL